MRGSARGGEPSGHEPCPDALPGDPPGGPGPDARYQARESLTLAFVAGLQRLPPRERAALALRDVLGFRTAEVAEMLGSSEASVIRALRRARATLDGELPRDAGPAPLPGSALERALAGRFAPAG